MIRLRRGVVVRWLRLLNSGHLYMLRPLILPLNAIAWAMVMAIRLTLAQALVTLQLLLLLKVLSLDLSLQ